MKKFLVVFGLIMGNIGLGHAQFINNFQSRGDVESYIFKTVRAIDDATYSRLDGLNNVQLYRVAKSLEITLAMIEGQVQPPNDGNDPFPPNDSFGVYSAKNIMVEMIKAIGASDSKSNTFDLAASTTGLDYLKRISDNCNSATQFSEKASCKVASVSALEQERALIDLSTVRKIIAACVKPTQYAEKSACYAAGIRAANSPELNQAAAGCATIGSSDGKANCYGRAIQ